MASNELKLREWLLEPADPGVRYLAVGDLAGVTAHVAVFRGGLFSEELSCEIASVVFSLYAV